MEIEYSHGFEESIIKKKTTSDQKVYLEIFGRGIVIGFLIMFFSIIGFYFSFLIGVGIFVFGMLFVIVNGCIYEYHGGYNAEESGYLKRTTRNEYFDFLNTKSGKVRRVFVNHRKDAEGEGQ